VGFVEEIETKEKISLCPKEVSVEEFEAQFKIFRLFSIKKKENAIIFSVIYILIKKDLLNVMTNFDTQSKFFL
jgi:hypothetical protein